jgi:hypothetical protein
MGTYLNQELAVLLNGLVCVLSFSLLLRLYTDVQVHLDLLGLEGSIELVGGAGVMLGALRLGGKDLGLDEDTQARVQSLLVEFRGLSDLVVGDGVAVVEQQHNGHLVRRDLEGRRGLEVRNLAVIGLDLTLAQLPQPSQLATLMLVVVETRKAVVSLDDQLRWGKRCRRFSGQKPVPRM